MLSGPPRKIMSTDANGPTISTAVAVDVGSSPTFTHTARPFSMPLTTRCQVGVRPASPNKVHLYPCRHDCVGLPVQYSYFSRIGEVDEDTSAVPLKLEGFGMGIEFDFRYFRALSAKARERTGAVACVYSLLRRIIPNIVGIRTKLQ